MDCLFSYYLSGLYLTGVPNVLEKNMEMAYKLSIKACEQGNIFACANTSRMYSRGEGVEKNDDLAATYKKRVIEMEKQQSANFKPIELQRVA